MEDIKWLIETKDFNYWGGSGWTTDVYNATQYDTEKEAITYMDKIKEAKPELDVWVLDHMFY